MSSLKQRLLDDIKTAMRGQDRERLGTLRLLSAAIKQKEVDDRTELDDTAVLAIMDKIARQHRDSIAQYEAAGRQDLVDKEKSELAVVQTYLPTQLSEEEVQGLIRAAITETGAAGMKDMGRLMGVLRPKLQGRTDMSRASELVKSLLG